MAIDKDVLIIIKSSGLGEGEPDLGEKLMKAYLKMLFESGELPDEIIFMNSGIFLTTEGSDVLDLILDMEEEGVKIASCGTCLDYYGRKEKLRVGSPGNMRDTVASMGSHQKVLTP